MQNLSKTTDVPQWVYQWKIKFTANIALRENWFKTGFCFRFLVDIFHQCGLKKTRSFILKICKKYNNQVVVQYLFLHLITFVIKLNTSGIHSFCWVLPIVPACHDPPGS